MQSFAVLVGWADGATKRKGLCYGVEKNHKEVCCHDLPVGIVVFPP